MWTIQSQSTCSIPRKVKECHQKMKERVKTRSRTIRRNCLPLWITLETHRHSRAQVCTHILALTTRQTRAPIIVLHFLHPHKAHAVCVSVCADMQEQHRASTHTGTRVFGVWQWERLNTKNSRETPVRSHDTCARAWAQACTCIRTLVRVCVRECGRTLKNPTNRHQRDVDVEHIYFTSPSGNTNATHTNTPVMFY